MPAPIVHYGFAQPARLNPHLVARSQQGAELQRWEHCSPPTLRVLGSSLRLGGCLVVRRGGLMEGFIAELR